MQKNKNRPGYKKTKAGWIPEDWDAPSLGSITSRIGDGIHTTPAYVDASQYYFVNGNNLADGRVVISPETKCVSKDEYVKHKKDLDDCTLLLSINGTVGNVAYYRQEPVVLGKSAAYINCDVPLNKCFAFAFLASPKARRFYRGEWTGSTIKNLSLASIRQMPIPLPSLPEQEAIAEVLECWDKAIRGYERKIETKRNIKKGLMQRLLTGKMRLPGFATTESTEGHGKGKDGIPEGWKDVRLGEVCRRVTLKNKGDCSNLLTISGPMGLVNQEEYFKRRIAAKDTSGYYLLKRGQYAYNRSTCNGYPYGAIKRLNAYETGVVSTLYLCFEPKSGAVDSDFLQFYFEGGCLNRELYKIVAEGARSHGLLNVAATDFLKTKLSLPKHTEQQAIATVLSSADTEITALERKLGTLREQKRFLLNNMVTGTIRLPQFCNHGMHEMTRK
jgi:type I restriction enzyme S subunit